MNYYQLIVKAHVEHAQRIAAERLPDFLLVKSRTFSINEANLIVSTDESRAVFEGTLIEWFHEDEETHGRKPLPTGSLLWWKRITPQQAGRGD